MGAMNRIKSVIIASGDSGCSARINFDSHPVPPSSGKGSDRKQLLLVDLGGAGISAINRIHRNACCSDGGKPLFQGRLSQELGKTS